MTARYRSNILGYRQAFGGLAGVLSSVIVQRILAFEGMPFKTQYALIIVLGAVVMALCAIPLSRLKEYGRPEIDKNKAEGVINLIKRAPELLRQNKHFTRFTIIRVFDMVIFTVITFVIIASKELLGMSSAQIGVLVIMRTVGRTIGGFSSGPIARKLGERTVIMTRISVLGLLSVGGIVLCIVPGVPVFVSYIFAAIGGFGQSMIMGYMLYMIYSVSDRVRPDCITLNSILLVPVSFSSYFAGLLIDSAGYLPYFITVLVLSIILLATAMKILLSKKDFATIAGE